MEPGIIHYINKCKICDLPFPGEKFNKTGLKILFPDTLYSNGSISLKRLSSDGLKVKAISYTFKNNMIESVEFIVKDGKQKKLLIERWGMYVENVEQFNAIENGENEFVLIARKKEIRFRFNKTRGKWLVNLSFV